MSVFGRGDSWKSRLLAGEREGTAVPRSMQEWLPLRTVYADGIFRVGPERYSKSFLFSDVNYAAASREERERIFGAWERTLNSLDPSAEVQLTVTQRKSDAERFDRNTLLPSRGDGLDGYREEYNRMLREEGCGDGAVLRDMCLTLTAVRPSVGDARAWFAGAGASLREGLAAVGSAVREPDCGELLELLGQLLRCDAGLPEAPDLREEIRLGQSILDGILPESMEFRWDCFRLGDRWGRALLLREYGAYLKDDFLSGLLLPGRSMAVSVQVAPVPAEAAVREAEKRLLGVETSIDRWHGRRRAAGRDDSVLPYDLEQQRREMRSFLDDLTSRDQRMFLTVLTAVHTADSREALDRDTESLCAAARAAGCQLSVLRFQQSEGLQTTLPFGVRRLGCFRTLTTESLGVLLPFRALEVRDRGGICYGRNTVTGSLILADRSRLLNGNSFILGVSGAGKSFAAKEEIAGIILSDPSADVLVIDPEREYGALTAALGGVTVRLSPSSPHHVNAMELHVPAEEGEDPVRLKSEFILSLIGEIMEGGAAGAAVKSVVDRCVREVFRRSPGEGGGVPTLRDLRDALLAQPEPAAAEAALALEVFTEGSLNVFSAPSNVAVNGRLVDFDIRDVGAQLLPAAMLVLLDAVMERISANRAAGRRTYLFIDEIYLLFRHPYAASFLFSLWKRVRKYNAFATGVTQNVEDLLQSHTARSMLANSEFLVMLSQAPTDLAELGRLLRISGEQAAFLDRAEPGRGLLKVGHALLPFANRFPRDTALYRLMTTRPSETR